MFHGQRQFTLLQVFSWCLATSIKKIRQPCLKFYFTDYELINGYCCKLLKKKKKKDQVKMELYIKGHLVRYCKCPWMVVYSSSILRKASCGCLTLKSSFSWENNWRVYLSKLPFAIYKPDGLKTIFTLRVNSESVILSPSFVYFPFNESNC